MKKILIISLLAIFLASCGGSKNETPKIKIVQINVEGMTCSGCENTVKSEISKLEGIESVTASYIDKKAEIKFDENKTSIEDIEKTIQASGYETKGSQVK